MPEDKNHSSLKKRLCVSVAKRFFAKRALDAAGDGITYPDDGAEQDHGKGEHERSGHESNLRDFLLSTID